jgi:hypothetical protein
LLYQIAPLLAGDPKMGITSAVRRVAGTLNANDFKNTVRRIRRKYRDFRQMHGQAALQYSKAEHYDPIRHADAPRGTLARVKQNSTLWAQIGRNGWHPVAAWIDGEWIMRRDLSPILTPEELEKECAGYLAQIGVIEFEDGPLVNDEPPFGSW